MSALLPPHDPTPAAGAAPASRNSSSRSRSGVRVVADAVREASACIPRLRHELRRVLVGHDDLVDRLLLALLADGHVLLQGGPGLGKQLVVRAFAAALGCEFRHLPGTPDLEHADLVGSMEAKGPLFTHVLYVEDLDEAPPKVRAALVHAAKEREVRLDATLLPLPEPYLVVATCTPDGRGACRLPTAQRDRFLLHTRVPAPGPDQERDLIDVASPGLRTPAVRAVTTPEAIRRARMVLAAIYMDGSVKDYVVRLVHTLRCPASHGLRAPDAIRFEASPRATLGLVAAAKAHAFLDGRGDARHDDVRAVAPDVFRHRMDVAAHHCELEIPTSEDLIQRVLDAVPVD